jgi:hypothetical protein
VADTKADYLVMINKKRCPTDELHDPDVEFGTPGLTFSEWAHMKARTHRPVKCQGCGLFKIWEPRPFEWGDVDALTAEDLHPNAPWNAGAEGFA